MTEPKDDASALEAKPARPEAPLQKAVESEKTDADGDPAAPTDGDDETARQDTAAAAAEGVGTETSVAEEAQGGLPTDEKHKPGSRKDGDVHDTAAEKAAEAEKAARPVDAGISPAGAEAGAGKDSEMPAESAENVTEQLDSAPVEPGESAEEHRDHGKDEDGRGETAMQTAGGLSPDADGGERAASDSGSEAVRPADDATPSEPESERREPESEEETPTGTAAPGSGSRGPVTETESEAAGEEGVAVADITPEKAEEAATGATGREAPEEGASLLYVVRETTMRGRPARILSDGTIEAEIEGEGWLRFEDENHLNEYIDALEELLGRR